jgi:hypothetical protein
MLYFLYILKYEYRKWVHMLLRPEVDSRGEDNNVTKKARLSFSFWIKSNLIYSPNKMN